jgi:hypothetical protein
MRTLLPYFILGLVFVPTLMLLVDAKGTAGWSAGRPASPSDHARGPAFER